MQTGTLSLPVWYTGGWHVVGYLSVIGRPESQIDNRVSDILFFKRCQVRTKTDQDAGKGPGNDQTGNLSFFFSLHNYQLKLNPGIPKLGRENELAPNTLSREGTGLVIHHSVNFTRRFSRNRKGFRSHQMGILPIPVMTGGTKDGVYGTDGGI
jgi:hypothetical protein